MKGEIKMKSRTGTVVASVGCCATAVALVLMTSAASGQTVTPNVTVVNTSANPVPVTGTVTGQVTGSVSVTNSNLPVTIHNSVVPVEVSIASAIGVQGDCNFTFTASLVNAPN